MVSFARSSKFFSLSALIALGTLGAFSCDSPQTASTGARSVSSNSVRARHNNRRLRNVTPSNAGCRNPIALDDVPAEWTQVKPESLVTGDNGVYLLESVVFHEEMQSDNGTTDSITATTTVTDRNQGKDTVLQNVDCNLFSRDLKMVVRATDAFAQEDGNFSKQLEINYQLKGGKLQNQTATLVDGSGDFVQSHTKKVARFQKHGFSTEIRYYAISDEEFEMRRMITAGPVSQFSAMRFKLIQQ